MKPSHSLVSVFISALGALSACTTSTTPSELPHPLPYEHLTTGGTATTTTTTTTTGGTTSGGTAGSSTGGTGGTTTSADSNCPLVVSHVAAPQALSQQGDGTYPRMTMLQDGNVLSCFTRFVANGNQTTNEIIVSLSAQGSAATEIGQVYSGIGDIDNCSILQTPFQAVGAQHNRIWAAFRNHSRDPNGTYTTYRISVASSDDLGVTWASPNDVIVSQPPVAYWEPFLFNAPNGSLHLYYSHAAAATNQYVGLVVSNDGGQTWGSETAVTSTGGARDGMASVAPFDNGVQTVLLAVYESENTTSGLYSLWSSTSTDNGETWENRTQLYNPGGLYNAGAPQVAPVSNGALAVVFMTDEGVSTSGWPANAAIKLLVTQTITPSGLTWGAKDTLVAASAYWPGILTGANDDTIIAAYASSGVSYTQVTLTPVCQ